jgi:hypothetical protein
MHDTSITADTDDQVDIKIGGNDTIVVKTQGSTPLMQINAGASNNNLYIKSTDATSGISLSDNGGSINLAKRKEEIWTTNNLNTLTT